MQSDIEIAQSATLKAIVPLARERLGIPDEQLKTVSYQHLLELCSLIGADTFELFTAIQTQNPFAAEVVAAFVDQARSLLDQVAVKRTGA